MAHQPSKRSRPRSADTPLIEWVVGGIGAALFVACVALLIYQGVVEGDQPGAITTSVLEVAEVGDRHLVTFKIENDGTQTLSNLQVSARLLAGDREVESARTIIDYLPGGSSREGGFYFEHDPRELAVAIRAEGYQKP